MKKTFLLMSASLLFFLSAEAQNQKWAVTSDSSGTADIAYATDIDNAGNRYVAGNYTDTLFIDGNVYPNYINDGSLDAFIAKYNTNGILQWVKTINGPSDQTIRSMKVNRSTGEVYTGGGFFYDFYINGVKQNSLTYTFAPGSFGRTFIVKFNTDGTLAWSDNTYSISGYPASGAYSLAIAPDGNSVYLHTTFIDDVQFEAGVSYHDSSFGASGVLLSRHNAATGAVIVYRNTLPGYLFDGFILHTDVSGNVIFAGSHRINCMQEIDPVFTTCEINPSPATSQGFILKMNANFGSLWGKEISGTGMEIVTALGSDNAGNVYAYGTYSSDIFLSPLSLDSVGGKNNVFITKLGSSGNFIYAKNLNADVLSTTVYPQDFEAPFAVDKSGNIYAGGSFAGTLRQGTATLVSDAFPSPFYSNGFLMKLNNAGKYRWSQKFVGNAGPFDVTSVNGLAVNGSNIAAGGHMVRYNAYLDDTIYADYDAFWLSTLQDCDLKINVMASASMVNASNPVTLTTPLKPGYTYQWQRNNVNIAGATTNIYMATMPGNYKCVVTTGICTINSVKIKLTLLPKLGEEFISDIQIYPNPADQHITITLPQAFSDEDISIIITDITGAVVFETTEQIDANKLLNISLPLNIAAGTYLVRISGKERNTALPLMIE